MKGLGREGQRGGAHSSTVGSRKVSSRSSVFFLQRCKQAWPEQLQQRTSPATTPRTPLAHLSKQPGLGIDPLSKTLPAANSSRDSLPSPFPCYASLNLLWNRVLLLKAATNETGSPNGACSVLTKTS